jgi:hypothetical protein
METSHHRVSQITVISTSQHLKANSDKNVYKVANYTVLGVLYRIGVEILFSKSIITEIHTVV